MLRLPPRAISLLLFAGFVPIVIAQSFTMHDPSWVAVQSSAGLLGPTNIANLGYYWVATDLANNALAQFWTDRVSLVVVSNTTVANQPSNTSFGLHFNGTTQTLLMGSGGCPPTAQFGAETLASYFLICYPESAMASSKGVCADLSGRGIQVGGGNWKYGGTAQSQITIGLEGAVNTNVDFVTTLVNATSLSTWYTNGVQMNQVNQGGINHYQFGQFGFSGFFGFFQGYILEYAIYTNYQFTAGDIATLHTYAKTKYPIPPP